MEEKKKENVRNDELKVRRRVIDGYLQMKCGKVKQFEETVKHLEKKYREIENVD